MDKLTIVELVTELKNEMEQLGYSEGIIRKHHTYWSKLSEYAKARDETYFSEKLGNEFLEVDGITFKDMQQVLPDKKRRKVRMIRMLGDYQLHGAIICHYSYRSNDLTNVYYGKICTKFKEYCYEKGYAQATIESYETCVKRLLNYLALRKIKDTSQINIEILHDYFKTLICYRRKTISTQLSAIRVLIKMLLDKELIEYDFRKDFPVITNTSSSSIPSIWSKDELEKLFSSIDRGSPLGKRDYAIILLACRLGMRSLDIKRLKMKNINWEERKLTFIQSKTKYPVELPLTSDVGWAIIDYLKHGRPKTEIQYIFLKHRVPYEEFSDSCHLSQMIVNYMRKSKIPRLQKKRGLHSLRHTLASLLLEKDTPLSTISGILGHTDMQAVKSYIKIDINKLRECPLEIESDEEVIFYE